MVCDLKMPLAALSQARALGNPVEVRLVGLQPPTASPKEQVENHNQQDKAQPSAAIIAEAWAHVISTAAEKEQKDHENDDEWHEAKSSTGSSKSADKQSGSTSYLK